MSNQSVVYEFQGFRIDPLKRVLLKDGMPVSLTSKTLDTLLVLVANHGHIVSKDELMKVLWPDTNVEENNLTQQISMLRKALGEGARDHHFIVTVPGRGYSFVADVNEVSADQTDSLISLHDRSTITAVKEERPENDSIVTEGYAKYLQVPLGTTTRAFTSRALVAIAAVMVVGSIIVWTSTRRKESVFRPTNKSIAVLPFKALNNDPANEYLSTGMADALIARLSNIKQISVRPTSAVIKYANGNQNASAIGNELAVDSILEGTVQTAGDKVRVIVQLVSVKDGSPLWAQTFDQKITDIFSLQNEISEQVAQSMLIRLDNEEQRQLRKRYTGNVQAYQEYVRGRYFWNQRDEEGFTKSLDHFSKAIELDPGYGLAYAGLADAYILIAYYGADARAADEAIRKGRAAAVKALTIDESLAEPHASMGLLKYRYDQDETGADREFRRALELNPSYATAHHWYSEFLLSTGRDLQALAEIVKAQELDPLSPVINTTVGERLFYMRRYDDAIAQLRRTLETAPDFDAAHFMLGLSLEQKGLLKESIAEFQKVRGAGAMNRGAAASLAHAYAAAGQQQKARKVLHDLLAERECAPFLIAIVYEGLGEKQRVVEWLSKLRSEGNEFKTLLRLDPRLDDVRSDARFRSSFPEDYWN